MTDPFDVELTDEEQHADELISADLSLLHELIQLRIDSGLSQEDVATAMGRDPSAVSRFERLDSDPHMSTVRRYARAVKASVQHTVTDRRLTSQAHVPSHFEDPRSMTAAPFSFVVSDLLEPELHSAAKRAVRYWSTNFLISQPIVDSLPSDMHEEASYFAIELPWVGHAETGGKHD